MKLNLFSWFLNWFPKKEKVIVANCGHECKQSDKISAFGETITSKLPVVNGKTEYCHECLKKMVVRCAWCGKPIFIGDFITLYSPEHKDFVPPIWSVIYNKKPLQLVGCQRVECADSGSDYCGVWLPPGVVKRQQSGIEAALANPGDAILGRTENGKIKLEVIKHREMEE